MGWIKEWVHEEVLLPKQDLNSGFWIKKVKYLEIFKLHLISRIIKLIFGVLEGLYCTVDSISTKHCLLTQNYNCTLEYLEVTLQNIFDDKKSGFSMSTAYKSA